jgi:hypothetical protein
MSDGLRQASCQCVLIAPRGLLFPGQAASVPRLATPPAGWGGADGKETSPKTMREEGGLVSLPTHRPDGEREGTCDHAVHTTTHARTPTHRPRREGERTRRGTQKHARGTQRRAKESASSSASRLEPRTSNLGPRTSDLGPQTLRESNRGTLLSSDARRPLCHHAGDLVRTPRRII